METKRLIVSTNYINLHVRDSERERESERKRERGRKTKFKGKSERRRNKEETGSGFCNNSKSLPQSFYKFILQKNEEQNVKMSNFKEIIKLYQILLRDTERPYINHKLERRTTNYK